MSDSSDNSGPGAPDVNPRPGNHSPLRLGEGVGGGSKRPTSAKHHKSVWLAALLWAVLMVPLLRWGLPSRAQDDLLFGGAPPWPAGRYNAAAALQQRQQRHGGADTDLNPLAQRDRIVNLTPDEAARAEILRRYRLFSRQPDEMITFMALQRMQPRQLDLDPKLYQYGGGYIYLVGATLAAGALTGLVHLTSNVGAYLERPELFAAFYVVARCVTLVFGGLLLVAVWRLAARAAGRLAGWLALVFVALTPVFITGALEAKPHLPAACLILWATLSALDYLERGLRRDAVRLGLQAGYAFGLVLTGIVGVVLWPVLLLARRATAPPRASDAARPWRDLLLAVALVAGVYLLTNPYIPYNLLFNRAALASNVGNSTAMYAHQMQQVATGAGRVGTLLLEACGIGVIVAGAAGLVLLLRSRAREAAIMIAPGLAMLLICVLLGAGKPAEFARFLLLPATLLCIAAACVLAALGRRQRVVAFALALLGLLGMRSPAYVRAFIADARGHDSRYAAAVYLEEHARPGDSFGVLQEPAPFAVPPLDFAHRSVYWLPPARPAELDSDRLPTWLVFTADDQSVHADEWWHQYYRPAARFAAQDAVLARIAWADKPVFVYERVANPVTDR